MAIRKTKNDQAWESLFTKYNILDNINDDGHFMIRAKEINEFREARLMTKFDHKANLPSLFQDHKLSILPITRGDYIISDFEAYRSFEQDDDIPIKYLKFPNHIQSIDFENITSEATAINCAYVSGMLQHFIDDDELLPTVNGRMSSDIFDFKINKSKTKDLLTINVTNSQIEIDGGLEGIESLSIIEAKNSISTDFLVRQLYYPYRLWQKKITKKIRPIFLVYSNGIFHLYEYEFSTLNLYNSIILKKQQRYCFEEESITLNDIQNILNEVSYIDEPKIPFPQADSFDRIINLCELLFDNSELSKDDITTTYDFDKRQTDYYTNAARYLGLVKKIKDDDVKFVLTEQGKNLFKLKIRNRQLKFVELILQHSIFSKSLSLYLKKAECPSKEEIINLMKESNLYRIEGESTFFRRASTITGWLNWLLDLEK